MYGSVDSLKLGAAEGCLGFVVLSVSSQGKKKMNKKTRHEALQNICCYEKKKKRIHTHTHSLTQIHSGVCLSALVFHSVEEERKKISSSLQTILITSPRVLFI